MGLSPESINGFLPNLSLVHLDWSLKVMMAAWWTIVLEVRVLLVVIFAHLFMLVQFSSVRLFV